MLLFTDRSIYITKLPNKPISQGYQFLCIPEKGSIWEFHQSSNAVGGDLVDIEFLLVHLTESGKMIYHLIQCLHQRHQKLSINVYRDNVSTTPPLEAELCQMLIVACGTCKQQFWVYPKELKDGKNNKSPNYSRSGAVNNGAANVPWMDSSPITMMSTIHPLSAEDLLVLQIRNHLDNKSTNMSGANSPFYPKNTRECLIYQSLVVPTASR